MTDAVSAVSGARQPAPLAQPDMRPTADVAALSRDPTPQIPMPIPSGSSQTGVVNETRMAGKSLQISSDRPPERVMKPYGISMLPESFEQNKVEIESDEDAAGEDVEQDDVDTKNAASPDAVETVDQSPPAPEANPPKETEQEPAPQSA